ncbi:putative Ig domain-containing protein [Aliikangiella sp. G2MR2-5]|uniref:putative Ig domain-containing protein n=1 Tax=Aliikangiella sp. G2MR2-5 TaxID=2788943 RepID=UPI0018AA6D0C|nr:putative Ig domain-containing protein [Aliikangiella sp. G2MR2-5]
MFSSKVSTNKLGFLQQITIAAALSSLIACSGSEDVEQKSSESSQNKAPVISGKYPSSAVAGEFYDYTPSASDEDGDSLSFSIQNKPDWASFDSSTGRLYGSTGQSSIGDYGNIVVSVTDGQDSDELNAFNIEVEDGNGAAILEDMTFSSKAGITIELTLGPLTDNDGDELTYTISGTSNVTRTSQENVVTYLTDEVGTEVFTVSCSDGINSSAQASVTVVVTELGLDVYYLSPEGSDNNDGTSASTPWRTFERAFDTAGGGMEGGDELILLDGTYSIANGTGILREVDDHGNPLDYSGSIPSGINRDYPTIVRAANPGRVIVAGPEGVRPIFIGRSSRKDRYIEVSGMRFEGGGTMFNSQYVVFRNSGFHGPLTIGTNDHDNGNTHNLIEDVWVWTNNWRASAMNYKAHYNVWRRVILRSDGCDEAGCESAPKADPSIGFTVYDSHDVSVQNVIVVDRLIRNDSPYGDFATAQHTADSQYHLGRNEWLGTMSINSQDAAMHFEADNVIGGGDPIWTIKNFVAVGNPDGGINIGNQPYNYGSAGSPPSVIENSTIVLENPAENRSGIRVSSGQHNVTARNTLAIGATRTGFNMLASTAEDSVAYNPQASEGDFDVANCIGQCVSLNSNPLNNGSLIYPTRVEAGSAVDNAISGESVGATVMYQYGISGTIHGEAGYNMLSDQALWPWPNEDRIKKEMCEDMNITRGFCSTGSQLGSSSQVTLTSYIWESLGNPMPTNLY